METKLRDPNLIGEKLYTADDVAELMRCTTETVWRKCRNREWPYRQLGRHYKFSVQDIHEIQEILRPKPVAPRRAKRTPL